MILAGGLSRQLKPATAAGRPKVASYWSKQRFTHTQAFNIHVTQRETESQRTGPLLNNSDSIVFKQTFLSDKYIKAMFKKKPSL